MDEADQEYWEEMKVLSQIGQGNIRMYEKVVFLVIALALRLHTFQSRLLT